MATESDLTVESTDRDNGHIWVEREGTPWPFCRKCGLVKRADGTSNPCKGQVKVALR